MYFFRKLLDLCSTGHDCHTDAQCVFDANEMRQKCICDQGFEGDGLRQCSPLPGKYANRMGYNLIYNKINLSNGGIFSSNFYSFILWNSIQHFIVIENEHATKDLFSWACVSLF